MIPDLGIQAVSCARYDLNGGPQDVLPVRHVGVVRANPLLYDDSLPGQALQHLADTGLAGFADKVKRHVRSPRHRLDRR